MIKITKGAGRAAIYGMVCCAALLAGIGLGIESNANPTPSPSATIMKRSLAFDTTPGNSLKPDVKYHIFYYDFGMWTFGDDTTYFPTSFILLEAKK